MNKKSRTYEPEDQRAEYHKGRIYERFNSFLKTQCSIVINKVRGLGNVACYALCSILCLVLNMEAAENIGRKDTAVSPHSLKRNIETRQHAIGVLCTKVIAGAKVIL